MDTVLKTIGLTDYYFKELIQKRKDYLVLLLNGICGLNLQEEEIKFTDTEERDLCTLKTINYDIKLVSDSINIDIEAQVKLTSNIKDLYGEYEYDVHRAIYYLSALHSRSYAYKEKGYVKKKSIVIFLFKYDIAGKDAIQRIRLINESTLRKYEDIELYFVSLEKIPNSSTIELNRALKLLSCTDMAPYIEDDSNVIREAAGMLCDYDKSERAQMLRDAQIKQELEEATIKNLAKAEGIAEGALEQQKVSIRTMHKNGFEPEMIAKALSLDLSFVEEVLKK